MEPDGRGRTDFADVLATQNDCTDRVAWAPLWQKASGVDGRGFPTLAAGILWKMFEAAGRPAGLE